MHGVFPPADRHGDVARVHTEVLHRRDGDLRILAVVAALRAAKRAEMAVRAVVIDILCLAVDAVRRVGDLRQVVAAKRHVHAKAHDRVRHLCRDGRDERTVGIDAQCALRRVADALEDVVERVRDLAVAVELIAEHVRGHDYLRLEILEHRFGRRLVALDDGELALRPPGQRTVHGKLRRDAGNEVRARAVGKVIEPRIGERLLDHAGAGRFAVRTGDEDNAHALREHAEHLRAHLERHPAGKRRAAAAQQPQQAARELT